MYTHALKALPFAMLLAASSTALLAAGDEPSEKKEKTIVVTEDQDFSDGDGPFVWSFSGHSGRGRLGVRLLEMTPELRSHYGAPRDAGVLVAGVESGSAAAKAGIKAGDIITRAGGEHVENAADLARAVRHAKAGDPLKLEIMRDRAAISVTARVEKPRDDGYEIDLGDLGRHLERDLGRNFGRDLGRDIRREIERHAWAFPDHPIAYRDRRVLRDRPENLDRLHEKLEQMEKRLSDLEKKLPR